MLDMYVALDVFTIDDLKKLISDNQWCVRAINFRLILDNGISTSEKRLFIETLLGKKRNSLDEEISSFDGADTIFFIVRRST